MILDHIFAFLRLLTSIWIVVLQAYENVLNNTEESADFDNDMIDLDALLYDDDTLMPTLTWMSRIYTYSCSSNTIIIVYFTWQHNARQNNLI